MGTIKKELSFKDPAVKIAIITIGIVCLLYFSVQKFVVHPYKRNLHSLRNKITHIDKEKAAAESYREISSLEKAIPPQKDPSWLLTRIAKLAETAGIDIESVEPLPVRQMPPYSYVPFKIKTACTFRQFFRFTSLVEADHYILNIESAKLKSKEEGRKKRAGQGKDIKAQADIVVGTIY